MAKRIALLTTLILSLVLLPGCPNPGSALAGTWVFTIGGLDLGMQLNANGEAVPFMIDINTSGTFTWSVDGTRMTLDQVDGIDNTVWEARLTSDTMMFGAFVTWAGVFVGDSNTFSAVKQ